MLLRHPAGLLRISALAAALAAATPGLAADLVDLHALDAAKLSRDYHSATKRVGVPSIARERHAELLNLDADSSLQTLGTAQDADGTRHFRYQQLVKGIPVWGEHVVISEQADGSTRSLFGRLVRDAALSATKAGNPHLNSAQALQIGKSHALGQQIAAMHTQREKSQLMVYVDPTDPHAAARTIYQVEFFADTAQGGSPTRPFILVDASSGEVIKSWDGLTTAQIGTGPGGNTKTGQYEWGSGGKYGYLDVTQSGSTCSMSNTAVKTVNLNGGTSGSTAFSYTCPRNTVKTINGGYSPLNDAHYFGGVIQNMYNAYTGSNALTFQLVMRTHYSSNYENAFWDGTQMSFGDGASTFYPLVNADVSGHEVSHGFTEQHSNLTYSGQSGGMNEAFSDMGGEATEYYWQGSNDFLVGKEIFKSANGALRYMANPPQDGSSIDNAANYTSSMDVHYSSGVYNKAFYLLATTSGWNTVNAFKVFARANALYWTPSSTFNSGACGVETAATDLGFDAGAVTAAFNGVGVSCPTGGGGGGGSTTTDLSNGVPATGIAASTGSYAKFKMVVPAGSSGLKFVMSGGTGDADMYVKFGSEPTDSSYDCRPYANGNAETCTMSTTQAGTYYVNLKAYSSFSGVSLTGSYTGAASNTPPVANFSVSTSNLTATFTDSSTDSDGTIASRSWEFGDGSTSSSTSPSHTYAAAGSYTVSLTVTDNSGATNTKTASVTVTAPPPPTSNVLSNGVPATGLSASTGGYVKFTMDVPAGATGLSFVTSGGTGDSDMYVKFGAEPTDTVYDCRPYASGNAETCTISNVQAGTYYINLKAYSTFSGVSLTGSYTAGGGGGGGTAQTYTNGTNYTISDNATATSSIAVSGRSGNAPSSTPVAVDIKHTYIGDLIVDLIAPDGSIYNLSNRAGGSADNIIKTYTVNLSTETINGTWSLRVQDKATGDTGYIDSFSITF